MSVPLHCELLSKAGQIDTYLLNCYTIFVAFYMLMLLKAKRMRFDLVQSGHHHHSIDLFSP